MAGRPPPGHGLTPRAGIGLAAGLAAFLIYWGATFSRALPRLDLNWRNGMSAAAQRHNDLAGDLVKQLVRGTIGAGGDATETLVVLESVLVGTCLAPCQARRRRAGSRRRHRTRPRPARRAAPEGHRT